MTAPAPTAPAPQESGTFFLLPPHHRLFAVFDDPVAGNEVAEALRAEGTTDDVWTFYGAKGIESLDSRIAHKSVHVGVVRVVQRVLTNDCEYCDALSGALRHGAMVLAARVGEREVADLSERLAERGAHSFAYGSHWNFVPLQEAGHTIGYFSTAEGASGAGEAAGTVPATETGAQPGAETGTEPAAQTGAETGAQTGAESHRDRPSAA